jgi:AhpD family alkylhydroperoxidase
MLREPGMALLPGGTPPLPNPESDPRVKAVFDDIRATRKTDFINNLWLALAFSPDLLASTWTEVKTLMATPSHLDPLTKEMIYIAVSVANACSYCVHSHTAAARAKGMSDAQHAELLAIIALAASTGCGQAIEAAADIAQEPSATAGPERWANRMRISSVRTKRTSGCESR